VLSAAAPAPAQVAAAELSVSSARVEVGEGFTVQLTIATGQQQAQPHSPELRLPRGLTAQGPSTGIQQQVTLSGGRMTQRQLITATWTVVASRPGKFTIGPASMNLGRERLASRPVSVEVVAVGQGSPRPRPGSRGWPFDDDDFFGGLFGGGRLPPGLGLDSAPTLGLPAVPEEYVVEQAPDPIAFVRTEVTPTRVVVGEQVTLRIYAYGSRGPFREAGATEPERADFLTHNLNEPSQQRLIRLELGGEIWHAAKLRELALFPIRTGTFQIGASTVTLSGSRYGVRGEIRRQGAPVEVVVTEPPTRGRPPGYRVGDVGRYELTAEVSPRRVKAGGAVAVVATLQGTGSMPLELRVPQRTGVEWSQPNIAEDVKTQDGRLGGSRKFSFVVDLDEPGTTDLGQLELPHWDPDARRYAIARAKLGQVEVEPDLANSARPSARPERPDELAPLLVPRAELGTVPESPVPLTESRWFWAALVFGPLGVLITRGSILVSRTVGTWRRSRGTSLAALARSALNQAETAATQADGPQAASAVERAVFLALEAATGLRARGILRSELSQALVRSGLTPESANETHAILEACDALRFVADETSQPEELVTRGRRHVNELLRVRRASAQQSSGGIDNERTSR
jgi:hypothetical protein